MDIMLPTKQEYRKQHHLTIAHVAEQEWTEARMRMIDADRLQAELYIAMRETITKNMKFGIYVAQAIVDNQPTIEKTEHHYIDAEDLAEIIARRLKND